MEGAGAALLHAAVSQTPVAALIMHFLGPGILRGVRHDIRGQSRRNGQGYDISAIGSSLSRAVAVSRRRRIGAGGAIGRAHITVTGQNHGREGLIALHPREIGQGRVVENKSAGGDVDEIRRDRPNRPAV